MAEYAYYAQDGDSVRFLHDPGDTWRWELVGANGKPKLEQGNFPSLEEAEEAARAAHGDVPSYVRPEE